MTFNNVRMRQGALLTFVISLALLLVTPTAFAAGSNAQVYLKGCSRGEPVQFFVDSATGDSKTYVTADNNVHTKGRALETLVQIPEGYTEVDVLVAECGDITLATLIAPAANYCAPQDGLGIYQEFASQSNKLCFKVRTVL